MSVSAIYRSVALYRWSMRLLYKGDYRRRFESVCALIRDSDKTVLELCFGDVAVARRCRARDVRWIGLDASPRFVAHAARLGFDARQADLLQGGELPACDLCVMMGSLYHFAPCAGELFARIKRASRRFVLSEPVRNWTHGGALKQGLARALTRTGAGDETFRFDERSLPGTLDQLRREVGFDYRVVSVSRDMVVEVVWSK